MNSSRLAVVGDSVGGNMTAPVTLLAKERRGPPITFQVLFYPVTDASFDTPSYLKYQEGYWLTRDAMKWFWDNYTSNRTNLKAPTVSPLQASVEQLNGLPQQLSSTERMMYCVMKEKHMPGSYWRQVFG